MAQYTNVNTANKWAKQVVAGKIPACKWVILACQRHLDDLKKSKNRDYPYKFDAKLAEKRYFLLGFCRIQRASGRLSA